MKKLSLLNLGFVMTLILISGCKKEKEGEEECPADHWEYEETWTSCYSECGGQAQSPIDISKTIRDTTLKALNFKYQDAPIELTNNGHTIQFNYPKGSALKLDGEKYELLQFHFHTQSEHTINEKHSPMEVHLVHKNESGALAVIGILFQEGKENPFLESFIDDLPSEANQDFSSDEKINIKDLIDPNSGFITYGGSLTTPPCSQIVTWYVLKKTLGSL